LAFALDSRALRMSDAGLFVAALGFLHMDFVEHDYEGKLID
jgi:hypothetical protein